MTQQSDENATERLVRIGRRSMFTVLLLILFFGAVLIAVLIAPHGAAAQFFSRAPWAFPILVVLFLVLQRAVTGKQKWDPRSPEVRALLQDELRKASLDRAARIALFVGLFLQVPLALLLDTLAPPHALLAMAVANITLTFATVLVLFLCFDRE